MKNFLKILLLNLFLVSGIAFGDEAIPKKPYDLTFIDEMIEHHKGGVEMAKIGEVKGYRKIIREMSSKMIKDQMNEIKKLRNWRNEWYPNAKPYNSHNVGMRTEELAKRSGNHFDVSFLDSMNMHHMGAIFLGSEGQRRGKRRELIQLAKKIASMQYKELNMMREMREEWNLSE